MKIRHRLAMVAVLLIAFIPGAIGRATRTTTEATSSQSADGIVSPIGNVFQIANQQNVLETRPDVAYNSMQQEYLVVWQDEGPYATIWGQRISKNGILIGPPFLIANQGQTTDRRYPRLAYNSKSDQYLVVWLQSDTSLGTICICGRYVTGSGSVTDSHDTVIISSKASDDTFSAPAVGYSYTSDQYLVVWIDESHPAPPSLFFVWGRAVSQGWQGNPELIEGGYGVGGLPKSKPEVAYNSLANQFMVVWQQTDYTVPPRPTTIDILALIVTEDLNPVTEKIIAQYDHDSMAPAIAALPIPPYGQYLVSWESHYATNDSDIQGRIFSPFGDPITNDFYISNIRGIDETQPAIAASPTRGQYLVTWRQSTILTWGLTGGKLVKPSGEVAGGPINLGGWIDGHSRVAAGWSGDFLTVYDDTPFTPDIGIYGILAGNRVYLALLSR